MPAKKGMYMTKPTKMKTKPQSKPAPKKKK